MKYIDISQAIITGMKKYPSDPRVEIHCFKSLKNGDSCNLSKIIFGSHTGTHIDAPRHVFNKRSGVDNIKIKDLVCDVVVIENKALLGKKHVRKRLKNVKGVLLKGKKDEGALTLKEAKVLIDCKMKVIGTEAMSIEKSQDKSHPVHRFLLGKGLVIVEGLDLKKARPGCYKLICLPLKIIRGDGAPARVILTYD